MDITWIFYLANSTILGTILGSILFWFVIVTLYCCCIEMPKVKHTIAKRSKLQLSEKKKKTTETGEQWRLKKDMDADYRVLSTRRVDNKVHLTTNACADAVVKTLKHHGLAVLSSVFDCCCDGGATSQRVNVGGATHLGKPMTHHHLLYVHPVMEVQRTENLPGPPGSVTKQVTWLPPWKRLVQGMRIYKNTR